MEKDPTLLFVDCSLNGRVGGQGQSEIVRPTCHTGGEEDMIITFCSSFFYSSQYHNCLGPILNPGTPWTVPGELIYIRI